MKNTTLGKINIKQNDYERLKEYYDNNIEPLIRQSREVDQIMYVGLSPASEELSLCSEPLENFSDENLSAYIDAAAEAYSIVNEHVVSNEIYVDGKLVCRLGGGFYSLDGIEYEELTFPDLLAVSLLQQHFDDKDLNFILVPDSDEWRRTVADEEHEQHIIQNSKSRPPWRFPPEKTVDTFTDVEAAQLDKWIKEIEGIQPARIICLYNGHLRHKRKFTISWTLNGVSHDLSVDSSYPTVAEMFNDFMKMAHVDSLKLQ